MFERVPISKKIRFEVFKRDDFTCQYCGKTKAQVPLEVDHILPVAAGGTNDILNLRTSCKDCNAGKGATLLDDQTYVEQAQQMEDRMQAYSRLLAAQERSAALALSADPERHDVLRWANEDEDLRWLDPAERRKVQSQRDQARGKETHERDRARLVFGYADQLDTVRQVLAEMKALRLEVRDIADSGLIEDADIVTTLSLLDQQFDEVEMVRHHYQQLRIERQQRLEFFREQRRQRQEKLLKEERQRLEKTGEQRMVKAQGAAMLEDWTSQFSHWEEPKHRPVPVSSLVLPSNPPTVQRRRRLTFITGFLWIWGITSFVILIIAIVGVAST